MAFISSRRTHSYRYTDTTSEGRRGRHAWVRLQVHGPVVLMSCCSCCSCCSIHQLLHLSLFATITLLHLSRVAHVTCIYHHLLISYATITICNYHVVAPITICLIHMHLSQFAYVTCNYQVVAPITICVYRVHLSGSAYISHAPISHAPALSMTCCICHMFAHVTCCTHHFRLAYITSLTGRKVAKLNKCSSAYQLANSQIFCIG